MCWTRSVAVKLYVPQVHSDLAARFFADGHELIAPDLLPSEFGNILWKKSRRHELSAADARRIARALLAAPLSVHASAILLEGALEVATRMDRTVYEGMYVALAMALGEALVTADRRLANALDKTPFGRHVLWVEDLP